MEQADLHEPLLLESQGADAVVEKESLLKQRRNFKPQQFLESHHKDDGFVDEALEKKDKQRGVAIRKVWFGLIAFFAIATAAVVFHHLIFYASKMELMATVVMPGVDISTLHRTAPQYRALEWLAYNDTRGLTINDDATELLERFSLVTFYYSVGGFEMRKEDAWSRWLTISSHCDWGGLVDCDEDGRVTTLNAFNFFVDVGTREIGNLQQQLNDLDLQGKKFSGTIPSEIGHLQQLKFLLLDDIELSGITELSGPIPSEIGYLQKLESLVVSGNKFSGPIPSEIGNLQQLSNLYLHGNAFSGPIPSEIGYLQQLTDLVLQGIKFSGPIPSEIGHLHQLTNFYLWDNAFSGTIPSEIGHLQELFHLGLFQTMLSGPIPSEIGHLQRLHYLNLSNNIGLTGTVPVEVGQLESIREAYFSKTSLTGLDDLAFCKNRHSTEFYFLGDCGGLNPKIT